MSVDFSFDRWQRIRDVYNSWWAGELNRPVIPVEIVPDQQLAGFYSPVLNQATCNDFSISPDQVVLKLDAELSKKQYLGDAFPFVNLDCFGPGVVAAFLGARLDNSTGRVWFHPAQDLPIDSLHFEYDPKNIWLNRIKDICAAANKYWKGMVMIGMPDLGGVLDILSVFRPGEKLLLDLYDQPCQVKRLISEIHEFWFKFYEEINSVLQPLNPGFSDWSGIYSQVPYYILQSDFSYMISTDMFNEFSRPQIENATAKLVQSFYHLDGTGQLPHLDSLLQIENLNGVQWVPGDGQPDCSNWPQVYKKIKTAGKRIQLLGGFDVLDSVTKQLGTCQGLQLRTVKISPSQIHVAQSKLDEYGVPSNI